MAGAGRGGAIPVMGAQGEAIPVMGAFGGPLPRLLWTYAVTIICGTLSYAPLTPVWAGVPAIPSCAVPGL